MDFFQRQEDARRSTRWLVALFALAVAGVVVAVDLAVIAILLFGSSAAEPSDLIRPELLAAMSLGTVTVVAIGSLYKMAALRSGGGAVAQLLGGTPLAPNTADPAGRRLLNVVEEMALAAGTPVPSVYVLEDEDGINAFAAGLTLDDAVIGVTRGTIDLLDRDELQGVIGHEMSHLLHGDSRLNVRLMGVLHGIQVIGLIGYWILRSYRGGSSERGKKGGAGVVLLFGLAMLIIGSIGVFFARLIKSAVSRQREFLADAASVQYTRDPTGLADALRKIGGLASGSRLASPNAEQASHLFFGNGVGRHSFSWLETHPPLDQRIRRLDPAFDGTFPKIEPGPRPERAARAAQAKVASAAHRARAAETAAAASMLRAEAAVASVGKPTPEHVAYASALRDRLPAALIERVRDSGSARAVVCALLLSREPQAVAAQLVALADAAGDPRLLEEVHAVMAAVKSCPPEARLALIDLAVPALRLMSRPQWRAFDQLIETLVEADQRLDVFELALRRVLMRHVEPAFEPSRTRAGALYYSLKQRARECSILLSAVARASSGRAAADARVTAGGAATPGVEESFARGAVHLPGVDARLLPAAECGPREVDASMRELDAAAPRRKQDLLLACAVVIAHDRRVTVEEGELLRALADALQCPMPPLLPGESLAAA